MSRADVSPLLVAAALATGFAAPAFALDCPKPVAASTIGLPDAAVPKVDARVKSLAASRGKQDMLQLLGYIHTQSPNAKPLAVAEYLNAAYCPYIAARSDLDAPAKVQEMKQFSADLGMMMGGDLTPQRSNPLDQTQTVR